MKEKASFFWKIQVTRRDGSIITIPAEKCNCIWEYPKRLNGIKRLKYIDIPGKIVKDYGLKPNSKATIVLLNNELEEGEIVE